ncbi:hypothetical protein ACGFKZ_29360 [Micromonospora tulbaghiae]|uniref:hypothetical protein n=1 Tax=Micromonospora tulbaghiae TaxID=479978 RepID=UPI003714B96A
MIVDGVRWWSTQQAVDQLGVTRNTINQWVSRSKRAGHVAPATSCPACRGRGRRFPHVDPPRTAGRGRATVAAYVADQLLAAEAHTAGVDVSGVTLEGGVLTAAR